MAVRLEGNQKRYIGLGSDEKPMPSETEALPAGSSFLESDTGDLYRWDGTAWRTAGDERSMLVVLEEIDRKLAAFGELFELIVSKL